MNIQLKTPTQVLENTTDEPGNGYCINIEFLQNLGFEKNEVLSGPTEWVYRYYRQTKGCHGIELVFSKDFSILSVEEFWLNKSDEMAYISNSIVGKFRICSDEDLGFIFSRNVKLNYIFNVDGKRV